MRAKLEFAEIEEQDTVYDLGCGDGRVLIISAQEYNAQGVGIEIRAGVVEEAWSNVAERDLEDLIEIRHEDYLESDLSDATLVVLYLTTHSLHSVSDKLQEIPSGARIVTHDFPLAGWPLSEQSLWTSEDGETVPLYLYRKP